MSAAVVIGALRVEIRLRWLNNNWTSIYQWQFYIPNTYCSKATLLHMCRLKQNKLLHGIKKYFRQMFNILICRLVDL